MLLIISAVTHEVGILSAVCACLLQCHPLQILLDELPTPIAAQNRQKAPEEDLNGVMIELKSTVHTSALRMNLGICDLVVVLLHSGDVVTEEVGPVDGRAIKPESTPQEMTLLDDPV